MSPRSYRFLPHTADVRVEVCGRDLPELFAACAEVLFSLVTDRRRVRPRDERQVRVEGAPDAERLFLLLRGAFALFSVGGFLVRKARVTIVGQRVTLSASGEPFDPSRHALDREIKAITAHALTVERTAKGFLARFVVDV